MQATKITAAPKLDGKLDDAVWQMAFPVSDFIVNFPKYGDAAAKKTEVRILYDDEAVYVGAMLYDDPLLIKKQLTLRDKQEFQDVDNFGISIDPYQDKQNAFQFIVTSVNVQSDVRLSAATGENDGGNFGTPGADYNWDAVWDSKISFADSGWMAEIKIPYSALRFAKKEMQDWNINFSRFIRRLNETSYWNPVDPKQDGFVNQFGTLQGLQNLTPPLRLSFLPYISGGYRHIPTSGGTIKNTLYNGGMDVKYGINESFTMDMTLIPDFGQVQSDNVILNLTPFEQRFTENRPFFTEGTELFNKAGIFYSRRIGGTPSGYYDALALASDSNYTLIKNPGLTQLYNATKFSGRTKSNLGIGIFNAVTAPMHAELRDKSGHTFRLQTEPLANYNIIVLDQALKNRSYITFTNTNVIRNGSARDANVSALNLALFNKANTYQFLFNGAYSHVTGTDAHNGFSTGISYGKVSGKWQWSIGNNMVSADYDPNDLGFLRSPNVFSTNLSGAYTQFNPNKLFNFRNYSISIEQTNLLKPFAAQDFKIEGNFLHVFKNFWDVTFLISSQPFWATDYFELRRGIGYPFKRMPYTFFGTRGSTDSRKKLYINFFLGYAGLSPIKDDPFTLIRLGARYRFSPKFSVEFSEERQDDVGTYGVALKNGVPVIINDTSIAGRRQVIQFTNLLTASYNFKARMTLSMRARHYWSRVNYVQVFKVLPDGSWHEPRFFMDGLDQNYNLFNLDMFFTWDFRLGSRLVIAWKNALGPDAEVDGTRYDKYTGNFSQMFTIPHSNELTVKFIYYIDYLQLRKKKN